MTLDELRNLNPKDIGNWPMPAKFGVLGLLLLIMLALAFFVHWNDKWDSINTGKSEEGSLRDTFLQKKEQAINLDGYKKQLGETEGALAALLKQLPNKSEMDAKQVWVAVCNSSYSSPPSKTCRTFMQNYLLT
jgi:type IV pilus assembly protein PilO